MTDELIVPSVPEPKPEDPEDVSWALSTAEAMWARGDHMEGIKWVRRAAEAASEAENDTRALELAKAAADLAGMISKRASRASIDLEEVVPLSEPEPPPVPKPANKPPPPKPAAPAAPKPAMGKGATPSRPPAPLPSKTSQPPPGGKQQNKPLGTNTGRPPSMRPGAPGGKGPESKKDGRRSRRSRENLDAEARAAAAIAAQPARPAGSAVETAKQAVVDDGTAARVLPAAADTTETAVAQVPVMPERPKRPGGDDPTTISHVNDVRPPQRSVDEWDVDSTQNLTGDDFPHFGNEGDRLTAVAMPPPDFKTTLQSFARPTGKTDGSSSTSSSPTGTNPPATVAAVLHTPGLGAPAAPGFSHSPAPRAAVEPHDPGITTTQAVRVVVWRDANGVHVAPAGTVVSAIKVDAVLVALEPNADLTAWLTQRGR